MKVEDRFPVEIRKFLGIALDDSLATPEQLRARLLANKTVALFLGEELKRLETAIIEHPANAKPVVH